MAEFHWRLLREGDLGGVFDIAALAFPKHYEELAFFAERLTLSPRWCFGLEDGDGALKGYLIAYPWPLGTIPPLNAPLHALPADARALFLHDLALHPDAAGTGQARAIVERLAGEAAGDGFRDLALVAVNGTAPFWERLGFSAEASDALAVKLASYGAGARYMRRRLAPAAVRPVPGSA